MSKYSKVTNALKQRWKTIMPWWMWAIAGLFVTFQFTIQNATGVMVDNLMHSFSINAEGVGIISGAFFYSYIILQIPAGMFVDRYGVRKVLTFTALTCAFGCWLFANADGFWMGTIARIIMGFGASCAFVGELHIINRWFKPIYFAAMVGLAETAGMLGTAIGEDLLAHGVTTIGWRQAMIWAAYLGFIVALLMWYNLREKALPNEESALITENESTKQQQTNAWQTVKSIARMPQAWLNAIYSGLLFTIITVFAAVWDIPFLKQAHHLEHITASIINSLIFVGVALGCPLYGWYQARTQQLRRPMIFGAAASLFLMLIIIYVPVMSPVILGSLMFLLGLLSSSYLLSFTYAKNLVKNSEHGAMMGFTNAIAMAMAPLFQPIIGWLLTFFATSSHVGYNAHFSNHSFHLAFMIMPIIMAVSIVLAWMLKENSSSAYS